MAVPRLEAAHVGVQVLVELDAQRHLLQGVEHSRLGRERGELPDRRERDREVVVEYFERVRDRLRRLLDRRDLPLAERLDGLLDLLRGPLVPPVGLAAKAAPLDAVAFVPRRTLEVAEV